MGSKLVLQVSLATILALASSAAGSAVGPQAYVEVWTDKGEGEIYNRGEAIDIFVESSFDAYVLVYTIDTDGYLNVVFPYDCRDDGFLLGGKTYRIVTGKSDAYYAQGSKGVAYIRAVASATPFRRLYWPGCPGYERYAEDVTWTSFADYWGPALPPQIYGDPYVGMQSIDEFICWDAVNTGAVSVGYTYYYVMEVVERPVYYVRAGWYWPHTWYWPCWDVYWNVCWDACWGVSVRFGSWYSYGRPCGWSWYGPTWCAPSWCWPTWYRPYYAYCGPSYCGPRYTVCATRYCGSCSRCTGSTCRTYPSRVKYKTNRLAAGGAAGTKVKAGQSAREYDLYTRDNGAAIKRKTYATAEDREGLSKIKQVSRRDASSSDRAVKSKSSRKLHSTESGRSAAEKVVAEDSAGDRKESARKSSSKQYTTERKAVRKTPVPVEAGSGKKKTSGTRSYEASETEPSSRKATVSKKASQIKSSTTRSETKVRTQAKVSVSKKAARVSSSRRVTTSSSSGGSSRNHRGSPTTRRSISR
jgi:hypothetical protein